VFLGGLPRVTRTRLDKVMKVVLFPAMPASIGRARTFFQDGMGVRRFKQVGRRSEESLVGLARLLRASRRSVLRGVTVNKQVIIRNGWEAKFFW
jgi:hypothetical protein